MTTTAKNTNSARIATLEEQVAVQTEILKAIMARLDNPAPAKQAKNSKKSSSNKTTKKAKVENAKVSAHYETQKAKNGNGEVIWLKFDKPCSNEQYCLLKALEFDPVKQEFKPLKNKKSLWSYSRTMKAYHAIMSDKALKQAKWFEKNYVPATEEELAIRKTAFSNAK